MGEKDLLTKTCEEAFFIGNSQYRHDALIQLCTDCHCCITEIPNKPGYSYLVFNMLTDYNAEYIGSIVTNKLDLGEAEREMLFAVFRKIAIYAPLKFSKSINQIIENQRRKRLKEILERKGFELAYAESKEGDVTALSFENQANKIVIITKLKCKFNPGAAINLDVLKKMGFNAGVILAEAEWLLEGRYSQ